MTVRASAVLFGIHTIPQVPGAVKRLFRRYPNYHTCGNLDNTACFQMCSRLRIYIIGLQIATRVAIWIIQLAFYCADGGAFM